MMYYTIYSAVREAKQSKIGNKILTLNLYAYLNTNFRESGLHTLRYTIFGVDKKRRISKPQNYKMATTTNSVNY